MYTTSLQLMQFLRYHQELIYSWMCDIYFLNRATNCIFFVIHVWIFLQLCINFRGNSYTIFRINADWNNAIVRYRNVDDTGCFRLYIYIYIYIPVIVCSSIK